MNIITQLYLFAITVGAHSRHHKCDDCNMISDGPADSSEILNIFIGIGIFVALMYYVVKHK